MLISIYASKSQSFKSISNIMTFLCNERTRQLKKLDNLFRDLHSNLCPVSFILIFYLLDINSNFTSLQKSISLTARTVITNDSKTNHFNLIDRALSQRWSGHKIGWNSHELSHEPCTLRHIHQVHNQDYPL